MTFQAERAEVGDVTFSPTLNHWRYVIRIPETAAEPAIQIPFCEGFVAGSATQLSQAIPFSDTVDPAHSTDAFVTLQNFLPEIAGIAAETPLFDAELGAER